MIADRCFDEKTLYRFLERNADQFSSSLHEQIARSGNGDLEQYTRKLSTKATIAFETDGDAIKGMLIGYTHDLPADKASYITYVIIDKKYRRQGVMKRILGEYEEYCKKQGVLSMWLLTGKINLSAQKAYESCGFVCEGEATERTVRYRKSL